MLRSAQSVATMMVPRSFQHAMGVADRHSSSESAQDATQSTKTRHVPKHPEVVAQGKPKQLCVAPAATPSKPVIIPSRTPPPKARRNPSSSSSEKDEHTNAHDPKAVPPSMAALLALTSWQNSRGLTIRRNASGSELGSTSFSPDDFRHVLSTSSPKSWSILQSPPEDGEMDRNHDAEAEAWSITSGSTIAATSPDRSLSYESMLSLDMELDSDSPSSGSPPTPANRSKMRLRREKLPSPKTSVPVYACHPLSPQIDEEAIIPFQSTASKEADIIPRKLSPSRSPPLSPFRSNLTASLRRLKSAARTLTTTPSRSGNPNQPYPSYNSSSPIKTYGQSQLLANIDAIPLHLHLEIPLPAIPPTASIQLMPYVPSTLPTSPSATAPPVFLPPANPPTDLTEAQMTTPRPREPRENSDFLRVVVMEMNMRRAGKLDGEGKARIWLGPRRDGEGAKMEERGDVLMGVIGVAAESQEEASETDEEHGTLRQTVSNASAKTERAVPRRWVSVPAQ